MVKFDEAWINATAIANNFEPLWPEALRRLCTLVTIRSVVWGCSRKCKWEDVEDVHVLLLSGIIPTVWSERVKVWVTLVRYVCLPGVPASCRTIIQPPVPVPGNVLVIWKLPTIHL